MLEWGGLGLLAATSFVVSFWTSAFLRDPAGGRYGLGARYYPAAWKIRAGTRNAGVAGALLGLAFYDTGSVSLVALIDALGSHGVPATRACHYAWTAMGFGFAFVLVVEQWPAFSRASRALIPGDRAAQSPVDHYVDLTNEEDSGAEDEEIMMRRMHGDPGREPGVRMRGGKPVPRASQARGTGTDGGSPGPEQHSAEDTDARVLANQFFFAALCIQTFGDAVTEYETQLRVPAGSQYASLVLAFTWTVYVCRGIVETTVTMTIADTWKMSGTGFVVCAVFYASIVPVGLLVGPYVAIRSHFPALVALSLFQFMAAGILVYFTFIRLLPLSLVGSHKTSVRKFIVFCAVYTAMGILAYRP